MQEEKEHTSPLYWNRADQLTETLKGYGLLFVDDEEELLNMLRSVFGQENTVYTSLTGAAALAVLETAAIDVVLLDLHMPGTLTAVQTLTFIKKEYPWLSVVIFSAYLDVVTDELSIADEFIEKPLPNVKLASVLKFYAELSRLKKMTGSCAGFF